MSEEKEKNELTLETVLERIGKLKSTREEITKKEAEIEAHTRDLASIEKLYGEETNEYQIKNDVLQTAQKALEQLKETVSELSFTKSELKPVFDEVTKQFEDELRAEQEREYHLEIGSEVEDGKNTGRKTYKNLMDYLYKSVRWTPKSAPGLMVLVRNMEENKEWVKDKDFDNVIKLRSSNILVLWRSILEEVEGHGFYEARSFLETWANCGKSLSEAVRSIQASHEVTRELGSKVNTIEDEYDLSFDDLEKTDEVTTQQEVDPEV